MGLGLQEVRAAAQPNTLKAVPPDSTVRRARTHAKILAHLAARRSSWSLIPKYHEHFGGLRKARSQPIRHLPKSCIFVQYYIVSAEGPLRLTASISSTCWGLRQSVKLHFLHPLVPFFPSPGALTACWLTTDRQTSLEFPSNLPLSLFLYLSLSSHRYTEIHTHKCHKSLHALRLCAQMHPCLDKLVQHKSHMHARFAQSNGKTKSHTGMKVYEVLS